MKLFDGVIFTVSGVLIYMSVLLPTLGLKRNAIPYRLAVILSGIGVGIGAGCAVFWEFSNRDFLGSCFTGGIAASIEIIVFKFFNKAKSE